MNARPARFALQARQHLEKRRIRSSLFTGIPDSLTAGAKLQRHLGLWGWLYLLVAFAAIYMGAYAYEHNCGLCVKEFFSSWFKK